MKRVLDHLEVIETVRAYSHKADYIKQLTLLMNFWNKYILSLKDSLE